MKADKQTLLAEYQAAIAGFHHYDTFRWDAGSLLVAGSLVLLGLLFSYKEINVLTLSVSSIFITLLLSAWLFFANHYRQLYMAKVLRMHEIEADLGMSLNRNLGIFGKNTKLNIYGPKGHDIDTFIYITMSAFGPFLIGITYGFNNNWILVSFIIIILTVLRIRVQERKMKKAIFDISKE